jgi:hypothetical protein
MRNVVLALIFSGASATYAAPAAESGPVQVVAQLYRDFAWEAVVHSPDWDGRALLDQPRAVLERYFDSNLATLILRDRECVAQTGEICQLDFSPIWASQDPGASELNVAAGPSPDVVNVRFRYPGDGKKIELSYRMVKTRAGWRIADIHNNGDWALLSILSGTP